MSITYMLTFLSITCGGFHFSNVIELLVVPLVFDVYVFVFDCFVSSGDIVLFSTWTISIQIYMLTQARRN